jgi:hypothetical protein
MDACPHWGTEDRSMNEAFLRVARCDGCAGLAAMALAAGFSPGRSRKAVVAAMVGGALPDVDKPLVYFAGWNPFPAWFQRFHMEIQNESPRRLPVELGVAAALSAALVAVTSRRPG